MDADAKLIAQAASRTIAAANANAEDESCRWCGGTNCCHEINCPIITLIDIVMLFASKTDEDKTLARERLEARRDLALKLRDCASPALGETRDALVLAERLLESCQPMAELDDGEMLHMRQAIRAVVGGELLPYGGEPHRCLECGFEAVMDKFRCDGDRLYCPQCKSDDVAPVSQLDADGKERA